eukprot:749748-Hanusia_phi.AAC.2
MSICRSGPSLLVRQGCEGKGSVKDLCLRSPVSSVHFATLRPEEPKASRAGQGQGRGRAGAGQGREGQGRAGRSRAGQGGRAGWG